MSEKIGDALLIEAAVCFAVALSMSGVGCVAFPYHKSALCCADSLEENMSRKLRNALLIEAAVCFAVALGMSGAKTEWAAFPYAQIGDALRALSLSGMAGNLIAWAILILIACLPLGWLAFVRTREKARACNADSALSYSETDAANARGGKGAAGEDKSGAVNARGADAATSGGESAIDDGESGAAVCGKSCRGIFRGRPENWLMVLLSGLLIPGVYGVVNPEWLAGVLGLPSGAFSAATVSGCLNAILVAYIALRILRRTREGGRALLKGLNAMLIAAMIALVAAAFLGVTANVRDGFLNAAAGNTEGGLGMTYFMLILGGIVDALPMLGDLWALDAALGLVSARMNGEDGVSEAERLARRSSRVIAATVLSQAALNLLAALTARWNRAISLNVNLPVESLLIALALMLAARGIAENKRLRDDNALFI